MIVQEAARRVHAAADRLEVMKARIEGRHIFHSVEMQLAPMGSCSVLSEDRVDVDEIAPIVDPWSAGNVDRHASSLIIGAQHSRIASDKTIFHGIDAISVLR